MHAYTHTRDTNTLKNFKATKDIAAGQEILVRYAGAEWFESKSIPYTEVDYARTMWRPDLHPLPCRQNVNLITEADGRCNFAVQSNVQSGTVMDVSLCVEVSLVVVDQFPFLWDFVLTGAATEQTVCARGCRSLLEINLFYSYARISLCQILQACLPLSYAAQIPTTPNPDLANVRVSLPILDPKKDVSQCSVRFFVSVYLMCVKKIALCVSLFCASCSLYGLSLSLSPCGSVRQLLFARAREWCLR